VIGHINVDVRVAALADDLPNMIVNGRSVNWVEPTFECPFDRAGERPKMAGFCPPLSRDVATRWGRERSSNQVV